MQSRFEGVINVDIRDSTRRRNRPGQTLTSAGEAASPRTGERPAGPADSLDAYPALITQRKPMCPVDVSTASP